MQPCTPFALEALQQRSSSELLAVDLPFALQSKVLKNIRPVMAVLWEADIATSPTLAVQLEQTLAKHMSAKLCTVTDTKWKSMCGQMIGLAHNPPNEPFSPLLSLWVTSRHNAIALLETDENLLANVLPSLMVNAPSFVGTLLAPFSEDQRLALVRDMPTMHELWKQHNQPQGFTLVKGTYQPTVPAAVVSPRFQSLIDTAAVHFPQYLISGVMSYIQDVVETQSMMKMVENMFGNSGMSGLLGTMFAAHAPVNEGMGVLLHATLEALPQPTQLRLLEEIGQNTTNVLEQMPSVLALRQKLLLQTQLDGIAPSTKRAPKM